MTAPAYGIGIDMGGTNLKAITASPNGETLRECVQWVGNTPRAIWLSDLQALVADWAADLGPPSALGVAAPGLIGDEERAVSWMLGDREDLVGFDWPDAFPSIPRVRVLNDAKAALVAERELGAARGEQNVMLLTLGTGVGGAAIVDGRLLRGAIGRAGHLGHLCLDLGGVQDVVGTPGSLEWQIGEGSLLSRSNGRFADTRTLVDRFSQGEEEATAIWLRSVRALTCAIVSLVNVLDSDTVILGGGIASAGPSLLDPLQEELDGIEWRPFGRGVTVRLAELGQMAGALGAALYAMGEEGIEK